jgi:hypothetical protein
VGHDCSENFEKRARSAAQGAMMLEWRSAEHGLLRSERYRGVPRPACEVARRSCWEGCCSRMQQRRGVDARSRQPVVATGCRKSRKQELRRRFERSRHPSWTPLGSARCVERCGLGRLGCAGPHVSRRNPTLHFADTTPRGVHAPPRCQNLTTSKGRLCSLRSPICAGDWAPEVMCRPLLQRGVPSVRSLPVRMLMLMLSRLRCYSDRACVDAAIYSYHGLDNATFWAKYHSMRPHTRSAPLHDLFQEDDPAGHVTRFVDTTSQSKAWRCTPHAIGLDAPLLRSPSPAVFSLESH